MSGSILKDSLDNCATKGVIIPFPNIEKTESILNEQEEDVIKIVVPRGFSAKVIFEKKEDSSTDEHLQKNVTSFKDETACDIIKDIGTSDYNFSYINNYADRNNEKEETTMKKANLYDVLNKQLRFLLVSIIFIIISLIGITIFCKFGKYFIHPIIYIGTLIMGIGWGLTALASIKYNKV
ncbi:hypothetical protein [Clostridium sporogenes]|uniref:hypothetical protein n=1 Tax=Clostridium sporogenes TaxID=1509 RepID=UPI001FACE570|nr:hypothetical protein [Clostridium sporogenes]